ncbi:hypothetical protein BS47DRAFT_1379818 [Hydnum rufescens UP504]|uniref:Galactose-binding like protein n=1 Tax=Hydnum rufescens UP504 TaxID=1448309 RepID=A0A9P6E0U4_9AGAM|nr:hypothetical protein BS47DRAFT_1379818 [Hydnum rufescens UP504]
MDLITSSTQIRVSSTLEKSSGKKNLTDGSPETCWSSTQGYPVLRYFRDDSQGTPQYIQASFDSLILPQVISLTFQGGFAGLRCALYARSRGINGDDSSSGKDKIERDGWLLLDRFFPEDVNRKQTFSLAAAEDSPPTEGIDTPRQGYNQVKIVFEESSDFFGRIVVYDLAIEGIIL